MEVRHISCQIKSQYLDTQKELHTHIETLKQIKATEKLEIVENGGTFCRYR